MGTRGGLAIELQVGERIELDGGRIELVLEQKNGQRARLRIVADRSIAIQHRRARRPDLDAVLAQGACALSTV
ncbi:MAG: hypothetical protein ACK5XA_15785 [Tagaea sp.]